MAHMAANLHSESMSLIELARDLEYLAVSEKWTSLALVLKEMAFKVCDMALELESQGRTEGAAILSDIQQHVRVAVDRSKAMAQE